MPDEISNNGFAKIVSSEINKRLSVLSTAALITVQPSHAATKLALSSDKALRAAITYFLSCVAIILALEAIFSFAFNTAFSDLVHHFYPVLVAALAVITIYIFLKFLMTPNSGFAPIATSTLYVGGTALLVMTTAIFILLSADFIGNYQSVLASGCEHRTIICLLSGNSQSEYGILARGQTGETAALDLGWSFSYIMLTMLGATLYYSHVLSSILKSSLTISRWRTYLATTLSLIVLAPACLLLINNIYRLIYT